MKFIGNQSTELQSRVTKDLAREVVAFLNTRDGVIYVGVDDDGTPIGVDDVDASMRSIRDIIRDQILPSTGNLCEIGSLLADDRSIVFIRVRKGDKLYYIKREGRSATGCFFRDGTSSSPMSEEEIERRFRESVKREEEGIDQIPSAYDELTFDALKRRLISKGVTINEHMFDRNYGLRNRDGRYNLMAELLSDQCTASIQICIFQGRDKLAYSRRNDYGHRSIIQSLMDVQHYCEVLNDTYVDDSSIPRKTRRMFDEKAFEEAWINAVVHNDWSTGNSPTIFWYENRMEILSYEGLPSGLSLEEFFSGATDPINPKLMEIFIQCGFVDRSGHGVPLIVERYGRGAFKFLRYGIQVTIPFDRRELSSPKPDTDTDTDDTDRDTERRPARCASPQPYSTTDIEESILDRLRTANDLSASRLATLLGVSISTVKRAIKRLVDRGILERSGTPRSGYWKINQP